MDADVEAAPRDVELSALEAEKQPMASPESGAAGPEKNGLVKAAGTGEAAGPKFTGLGKEELLRAAAAPGWTRARAALLAAFWLGWLGMLGAAVAIVARAPRCHVTGSAEWWRSGGLYRAPPEVFGGKLQVRDHLDYVASLAGGLLLGPLPHHSTADPPLEEWPPQLGSEEELRGVLKTAKEHGLQVLVELNHSAVRNHFSNGPTRSNGSSAIKQAIGAWLQRGFDGVFLDGIEELEDSVLAEFRNITEQWSTDETPRLLVGGTRLRDPSSLQDLLNSTKVSLVLGVLPLGPPLDSQNGQTVLDPTHVAQLLQLSQGGVPVVWSVGTPWKHLVGLSPPLAPQVLLLLWGGLPNAPTLNYGDEVGLMDPQGAGSDQLTPMPWTELKALQEGGNSSQAQLLSLSRRLRAMRKKEKTLAVGGAQVLWAGPDRGVAVLRGAGAGERFLLLLNPGAESLHPFRPRSEVATPTTGPTPPPLPPRARLVLSTHGSPPPGTETPVEMAELQLQPYEGLLLRLPPQ
uniref:Solute carrier family 3 member 2 N-terminal domain-containing protein n=1 Tax=Phasianus colchicus TaxID=9054 RepID=A0A669QKE2_PHACC